ncbi:hypothetical protein C8Q69DRAFT_186948 [Paecilomyces variotii]|uniref:Aminoglycoside phosphotransferase domain-containing protein n=1 Tax=Byssochlamys spectabilis TaxID=264951 RepID=A0A443HI40_BYSSP|nr:hypothetical protein C8Q69DRAFT_186948 [Paecilomyces variotii]KAJ9248068.1 hypothetical protein DTO195F2_8930 [Paecilomyces variotii]KAJ9349035.1 hypothetical protein DTO280E4_9174 [Paecilomyces variotii]KAJ9351705.1 hypothetical protein DTO027B9_6292 [Paecilomyces variotii]KAJ9379343.1 hypothetical protein DTO063F5_7226 [Paecilomyces variotii]RWQ91502.1 hypothetical protein C8Q69DRAFT_186948 [Paecilomyces variotii]
MPKTRPLLRGEITYSTAQREEVNILHRLSYHDQRRKFFAHILAKKDWIESIVAHHLNLGPSNCRMEDVENWRHGSFNLCVPVVVNGWKWKQQPGERVLLRFPLPYRVGDAFRPGNGDEKIRCEAGAYAWLQENCPDVPIPKLYGFATSTGETFTLLQNLPLIARCVQYLRRRLLSWLGRPIPTQFIRHQAANNILSDTVGTGYLLIEYIEEEQGEMLSNTWQEKQVDIGLRTNLFRDLSRILLSITRIPLPKIGSFMIDHDGFLHLTNRPLSLEIQELENENIPTNIPRDYTYSTVESYVTDILRIHDNRLRHQPNAINDTGDYIYQTSALAAMRTVFPSFFKPELRRGPFAFTFTDLHQSNIFVDKEWHITCLVDLEWACTRPVEMLRTPTWLTNKAVDEIAESSGEYNTRRMEFVNIMAAEEQRLDSTVSTNNHGRPQLSSIMNESWRVGTFWYSLALASPTGLFAVFFKQIQPRFVKHCSDHDGFQQIMPWYWAQDWVRTAASKLSDRKEYDIRLQQAFECDISPNERSPAS